MWWHFSEPSTVHKHVKSTELPCILKLYVVPILFFEEIIFKYLSQDKQNTCTYDLTKYNNEAIDLEKITLNGKFESAICILVIYVHYIVLTATFDFFYLIWAGITFIYKNV